MFVYVHWGGRYFTNEHIKEVFRGGGAFRETSYEVC